MASKKLELVDDFKVNIGPCMGLPSINHSSRYCEWVDTFCYTWSFLKGCERSSVKALF